MKNKELLEIPKNEATEGFDRYEDVYYDESPNQIIKFENQESRFVFQSANRFLLFIDVISDEIIRFRYTADLEIPNEFSYVLQPLADHSGTVEFQDQVGSFLISTSSLHCVVDKSDLQIKLLDRNADNQVISEDALPLYLRRTILEGTKFVKISKKADPNEAYFGLGDKSGALNLRGQLLENWNTDSFGYEADTDPLYRSIPFYYGLRNGNAYGVFLHNTSRSHFDFDTQQENTTSFWVEGGYVDYFFINGPELLDVARQYSKLTGTAELPPIWALGFHQCRWSYFPEKRVYEIADDFRKHKIPCDAIYLDIDYMDGFRCFTWNQEYFPDPTKMIHNLSENGFHTVVMIDPGIKADPEYWVYQDGISKNVFCRRTNGEIMVGPVWPDNCVFPDFTNPRVREWWKQLYTALYIENGVSGFWNDMNEPAVFKVNRLTFPDEVMHDFDGYPTTHAQAHNIYGLQMSRATMEGLKRLKPQKRPFLLTRATFSGGQRYAAIWTGDNIASWEHLRLANIQCQRISISGFSFVGTDIGGFAEVPDGELFVRWLQLGIFHPLYRVHSMGNHAGGAEMVDVEAVKASESENRLDQEPWSFGEPYTTLAKQAIDLRYQLLGYLYTAFQQYVQEGIPVLQSLVFYDQTDVNCINRENEFLCGQDLLVNPVIEEGETTQITYLPRGQWYEFNTNEIFLGQQMIRTAAGIDQIPIFVKAGTILPIYPSRQHTNEPISNLILRVYYASNGQSQLYEDNGEGYDYQSGNYILRSFSIDGSEQKLEIHQQYVGQFKTTYPHITLQVIGLPFKVGNCKVDGEIYPSKIAEIGLVINEIGQDFTSIVISAE